MTQTQDKPRKVTIHIQTDYFATNWLRQFDAGVLCNMMAEHPGLGYPCLLLDLRVALVHNHITGGAT